jgi:hypothetical protein
VGTNKGNEEFLFRHNEIDPSHHGMTAVITELCAIVALVTVLLIAVCT